ncbi:TPA: hypothetical protein QB396_001112, partial [Pasteurella multocida]|nr:hypothetical protein [Pasteurella multocida]
LKVSGLKSELVSRALSLPHKNIRLFILSYLKEQFPLIIQEREDYKVRKEARKEKCIHTNNNILDTAQKTAIPRMPDELLALPMRERLLAIRHLYQKNTYIDKNEYLHLLSESKVLPRS